MLISLTGASGFIGSYTARALKARSHRVRAHVRATSRRDHIQGAASEFTEGDIADEAMMQRLCDGADAVIHNAVDWDAVRGDPMEHFRRNVEASLRLLEHARRAGVKQFLFVSSAAVNHTIVTTPRIHETHPTWPGSLYGAYKAAIEPFLMAYHEAYGMNTSSWRPAAVYGVDPILEKSQWFKLISAAAREEAVDTDKGGKITHVQDVADALALAIGDEQTAGQVYNLVERHIYWCEPAMMAAAISGSGANIADRRGPGPKNHYETAKAVAFFDRHGHPQGLRRGMEGVRQYVAELLERL